MDLWSRLPALPAAAALLLAGGPGPAQADDSKPASRFEVGGDLLYGLMSGDNYEYLEDGFGFEGFLAYRLPPRYLRVRASLEYLDTNQDTFFFAFLGLEAGIPGEAVEPIIMAFVGTNEHGLAGGGGLGIRVHLSKNLDAEALLRGFAATEVEVTIFGEPARDNVAVGLGSLGILLRP